MGRDFVAFSRKVYLAVGWQAKKSIPAVLLKAGLGIMFFCIGPFALKRINK